MWQQSANCCPTCGERLQPSLLTWSKTERALIANGNCVQFNDLDTKIIDALWRTRLIGGIRSAERFMAMVYADDPDGGAENFNVISVRLFAIRKRLAQIGLHRNQKLWPAKARPQTHSAVRRRAKRAAR